MMSLNSNISSNLHRLFKSRCAIYHTLKKFRIRRFEEVAKFESRLPRLQNNLEVTDQTCCSVISRDKKFADDYQTTYDLEVYN